MKSPIKRCYVAGTIALALNLSSAIDAVALTDILGFSSGTDPNNWVTVSVDDRVLGEFQAGDRLSFVDLIGSPVSQFRISGINSLAYQSSYLPYDWPCDWEDWGTVSVDDRVLGEEGDLETPLSTPEPSAALSLLTMGILSGTRLLTRFTWKKIK